MYASNHFVWAAGLYFLFLANKDKIVSPLIYIQIGKVLGWLVHDLAAVMLWFSIPPINFFISFIELPSFSNHV